MPSHQLASSRGVRRARPPVRGVLAALGCAVALAGCGSVRVQPSTPSGSATLATRGRLDSPLTNMDNHLGCLQAARLPVQVVSSTRLQIGPLPAGPTIVFRPSSAVAQADQITGSAQGAMVIGTALVYPNQGSSAELNSIASCLAQGVQA
jgi:hypothetical protein